MSTLPRTKIYQSTKGRYLRRGQQPSPCQAESFSGPCRCLRYHELTTHKVTKSLSPLQVTHSSGCMCVRGGEASLPLPTRVTAICSPCRSEQGKPWPGPPTWAAIISMNRFRGLADDYVTTKVHLQSTREWRGPREEEEDLFVFNDTQAIEGPRAPADKPGRITQARA
jgi:hypothetical protein